jgi:hypothetical protein
MAGRLLVPCGLLVGLSALWMTLFYPRPEGVGPLLTALRLLFGSAMIAGPPSDFSRALLMGAGWVINLAVAEWAIRKRPARPARPASAVVSYR